MQNRMEKYLRKGGKEKRSELLKKKRKRRKRKFAWLRDDDYFLVFLHRTSSCLPDE